MGVHGTTTQVASANADTLLAAKNLKRDKLCIQNASTAILYVLLGEGVASATNFTVALAATNTGTKDDYMEVDQAYAGQVRGFWAAANGYAYVTEIT